MEKVNELLRGLAAAGRGELTDGQLLERFVASREEAAFEGLVRRHGPMVMGVCRRVLGRHADAEDAFQATFLVLARKADAFRPREHVAAWLHGVARRTALRALRAARRRGCRERQVNQMPEPRISPPQGAEDVLQQIDEELERLPERYRTVVLLCAIEGRSYRDAARQLGCAEGTVGAWLCRARQMLADRLSRRGLPVPAGALFPGAAAGVPPALPRSTARGACLFAAGQATTGAVPAGVAALAEGVLDAMFTWKLKAAAAVVLALAVVAGGACSLWALEGEQARAASPFRRARVPFLADQGAIAAPPAAVPPDVLKLIDQLGDEDEEVRKGAEKKLEALGEDVVPALRKAGKSHADADVRLRALVVAAAIEKKAYGEVRTFTGHAEGHVSFALSPDGKKMVSGCWAGPRADHAARIWDVKTGKELSQLKGHGNGVICQAWSPDGKRILTGSLDRTARLWDAATGKELLSLTGHDNWVHAVLFTPDGKRAVTSDNSAAIRVWDLTQGKVVKSISEHTGAVRRGLALTGGKRLASAGFDGTVRLFDLETGKELKCFKGHVGKALFVAFSPDGKRLASGGDDGVRLWDVATGKQVKHLKGHAKAVHGVAFSRDGRRVLSAGFDHTARVWDAETGEEVQRFEGHAERVTCAAFLDDSHAVTAGIDKTIRLWKVRK